VPLLSALEPQEYSGCLVAFTVAEPPAPTFEILALHFDIAPLVDEGRDISQHGELVVRFFCAKPYRVDIALCVIARHKGVLPQTIGDIVGVFGFYEKLAGDLLDSISHCNFLSVLIFCIYPEPHGPATKVGGLERPIYIQKKPIGRYSPVNFFMTKMKNAQRQIVLGR